MSRILNQDIYVSLQSLSEKSFVGLALLIKTRLQRDQEFSIPGFPGRDFAKSRDPGIFRDGISLKFLSRDFTEKYGPQIHVF